MDDLRRCVTPNLVSDRALRHYGDSSIVLSTVRRLALLSLVAVFAPGAASHAQRPNLAGVVRDSVGKPIYAAEVTAGPSVTRTDSVGRFFVSFPRSDSVTVSVRRMGYERVTFTVSVEDANRNDVDVVLTPLPFALPALAVDDPGFRLGTGLRGFDERRAQRIGVFVTRDDIARRNRFLLSEVLREERGVVVSRTRDGRVILRFTPWTSRGCDPLIWVDGTPAPGLNIDAVAAEDVVGVELYQGVATTPTEFSRVGRRFDCGTVVIWTKRPILERP